jgi:hypothetical protein
MNPLFEKKLDSTKNQLCVFSCPASLPFFFAKHLWFVVNIKGKFIRYEVIHFKGVCSIETDFYNDGYVYKNLYPPFRGISIFPWKSTLCWKETFEMLFDLDESLSDKDIDLIFLNYKHKNRYFLFGPNSNTYVTQTLRNIFKKDVDLPFLAIGKNYKK